ncbi:MAG: MOSC N-terminal beta barrel domain-containing protein [Patescibacteria group bacterium]
MRVSELWVYPVKSCRGVRVVEAKVGPTGFQYDREWMIVDEKGLFVSQRKDPILATIRPYVNGDCLFLCVGESRDPILEVPVNGTHQDRGQRVTIHTDAEVMGKDQGDEAARVLSGVVGRRVRLVKKDWAFPRFSRGGERVETAFSDGYPFLVTTTASLHELNERLDSPVRMNRFRPNIVVNGTRDPFEEDQWGHFTVGSVTFAGKTRCTRCPIVTTDQFTGARSSEPTRTLLTYRVFPGSKHPCFGLYADHFEGDTIRVGDEIVVHSTRASS